MSAFEPLDPDEDPERWIQRFEVHASLNDWKDEKRRNGFLSLIGKKMFNVLADAALPEKVESKNYDDLKELMMKELKAEKSTIARRYEFHRARQEQGESTTAYSRRLRQLSEDCKFTDLQERLRDQFVFGLQDKEILRKLLAEKDEDLTWERVLPLASACEAVQRGEKEMSGTGVYQLNADKPRKSFTRPATGRTEIQCFCCGRSNHTKKECRFRTLKCENCGKVGHLKAVCRATKSNRTSQHEYRRTTPKSRRSKVRLLQEEEMEGDQDKIFTVGTSSKRITRTVRINGTDVTMVFDTGADASLMSIREFQNLTVPAMLTKTDRQFKDYQGNVVVIAGKSIVSVEVNGVSKQLAIYVVDEPNVPSIYGLEWIQALEPELKICHVTDFKAHVTLKEGTIPVFYKPRQIPYGLTDAVKDELDRLVKEETLVKVTQSEWATPIVVVRKPNGKVRLCGDYKITVNPNLTKMVTTTPSIDDVLSQLGGAKLFSVLDLTNAYLQLPVDDESARVQTLSTPFGLYQPNSLAYGIRQAPAIFQNYMDKLLAAETNVLSYQDDILVYGKSQLEHDRQLEAVTAILKRNNVAINYNKSVIKSSKVHFLGFEISTDGIKPTKDKMTVIEGFAEPSNAKEVRSFLGMVEFCARFIKNLSTIKEPLTRLTRNDEKWRWGQAERTAFNAIKSRIVQSQILKPFDPKDEKTILTTDASPFGLGAVLEQSGGPVLFISKTLTKAERNYAQIEREALGIIWAVKRLHKYLFSRKFTLITDHAPLKFIFDPAKSVSSIAAARIQRWAISLMAYDYIVECRKSEEIPMADALSRLRSSDADTQHFDVGTIQDALLDLPLNKGEIRRASKSDEVMRRLFTEVKFGWTAQGRSHLADFSRFSDELTIENGLLYRGMRMVIPPDLRPKVLCLLHDGHLGADKVKTIARQCVWWPSIDKDIEAEVKACIGCQTQKSHAKCQWTPWPQETEKWSRVHIDFAGPFSNGKYCLVMIDAFSKWAEVHAMASTTTEETILRLRRTFSQEGVPTVLVSDNGPQFTSHQMEQWLEAIGCRHILTPPYHPRSNGQAERFVRDLKDHLRATGNLNTMQASIDRFLLQYRNAVHSSTGKAPAELMRGHLLRGPVIQLAREPVWIRVYEDQKRKWAPGRVIRREGQAVVVVENEDGKVTRRHIEQTKPRATNQPSTSGSGSNDKGAYEPRPQRLRKPPERLHYSKLGCSDN